MERRERHRRLLELLQASADPLTGAELASRLDVTRQVVVHDVALLRAQGVPVVSTPRGYLLQHGDRRHQQVLAVCHPPELTAAELYTLVDFGVQVLDVIVEHPLYGELRGGLHLAARRDVDLFLQQLQTAGAALLSSLTDGHHLHTVECAHPERLAEAVEQLRRLGIQVFED
ncbi:MAG: transcription repressor NadR [Alicyclobacillaceae bacterium]|nr:transcription repressor NadR [Alicyclobacillaceae bacterium]